MGMMAGESSQSSENNNGDMSMEYMRSNNSTKKNDHTKANDDTKTSHGNFSLFQWLNLVERCHLTTGPAEIKSAAGMQSRPPFNRISALGQRSSKKLVAQLLVT
eukprot:4095464-Amphidinium_carterae.1